MKVSAEETPAGASLLRGRAPGWGRLSFLSSRTLARLRLLLRRALLNELLPLRALADRHRRARLDARLPRALQDAAHGLGADLEAVREDRHGELPWLRAVELAQRVHGLARELARRGPALREGLA